jgi:hypothetical protein
MLFGEVAVVIREICGSALRSNTEVQRLPIVSRSAARGDPREEAPRPPGDPRLGAQLITKKQKRPLTSSALPSLGKRSTVKHSAPDASKGLDPAISSTRLTLLSSAESGTSIGSLVRLLLTSRRFVSGDRLGDKPLLGRRPSCAVAIAQKRAFVDGANSPSS